MSIDIDPADLIVPRNYGKSGQPHGTWTRLRESSPVHRCEVDGYEPFWAITRHADIMEISGQPEIFSNSAGPMILSNEQVEQRRNDKSPFASMRTIIETDPPEHRDLRKIASGLFTPRKIQGLDDLVTECAREHIDKFGAEGECDFVETVAQRHPLRVLATLLGVEREDEETMLELTQQLFGADDPDLRREGENREKATAELGLEFYNLFNRIIEDRRANPRDDLASKLANAKLPDGTPLGPVETFGYFLIVFTAGHDTTRNAIAGGMHALLENPDQLELLCKDPELAPKAIEEIVRWTSPVNYMRRRVMQDVVLHGQEIPAGDDLVMFYCSANRDDSVFDRPFEFDITRHPNRHLGFGTGEHFCLGAHVARLSSRALFLEIARRLEYAEPTAPATWIESSFVVGLKTLPMRYKFCPSA
ncbi:MAG: cytochrome P450 [Myxococcota bacterium]|jgi:cytochrome P450|nr:cytochrome P450 [Myxococcota bacterium]